MRLVALEEHFTMPGLAKRVPADAAVRRGYPAPGGPSVRPAIDAKLVDFGDSRLKDLDDAGISTQVLSMSGPGADLLPGAEGVAYAREMNDALAGHIAKHPKRYAGFAHLPLAAPDAAAEELERAVTKLGFHGFMVNGTVDGKFLDDPRFEPVLAKAEALDVPIYLHPGIPPQAVREAYYGGLKGPLSGMLAQAGWGWHSECAVHVLRLALSGALDRHPKLQIVIGHLGEGLQVMLDRFDDVFNRATQPILKRTVRETLLSQVHVTTSGFFSHPSFLALLQTFGADRVMFSVDYPYSDNAAARTFFDRLELGPADRAKIAHGNADRLLKLKA